MGGVQRFGEKRAFQRIVGRSCRSAVQSSNRKSLRILDLIAKEIARRKRCVADLAERKGFELRIQSLVGAAVRAQQSQFVGGQGGERVHCKLRHAMQIETEALRLAANPQKRPIGSLRVSGTLSLRPDCLAGAKDTNLHMVGPPPHHSGAATIPGRGDCCDG